MEPDHGVRDIINNLKIASPCQMNWDEMQHTPEAAVRFCGDCRKHVYDVAKMSAMETYLLLQKADMGGGSACLQLYRRADGTVISDDCPVGLRRIRDGWRNVRSVAATFAVLICAQSAFAQKNGFHTPPAKAPSEGRFLGFASPIIDWRAEAMKNGSIKIFADKIIAEEGKMPSTDSDKLKILRMRYEIAGKVGLTDTKCIQDKLDRLK